MNNPMTRRLTARRVNVNGEDREEWERKKGVSRLRSGRRDLQPGYALLPYIDSRPFRDFRMVRRRADVVYSR
jgi:hypothetical protein